MANENEIAVQTELIKQVVEIAQVTERWARFSLETAEPPWDLAAAVTMVISGEFNRAVFPPSPTPAASASYSSPRAYPQSPPTIVSPAPQRGARVAAPPAAATHMQSTPDNARNTQSRENAMSSIDKAILLSLQSGLSVEEEEQRVWDLVEATGLPPAQARVALEQNQWHVQRTANLFVPDELFIDPEAAAAAAAAAAERRREAVGSAKEVATAAPPPPWQRQRSRVVNEVVAETLAPAEAAEKAEAEAEVITARNMKEEEKRLAHHRRQEDSVVAIQHTWRRVCAVKELSERRTAVKTIGSAVHNTPQRWKQQRQRREEEEEKLAHRRRQEESVVTIQHIWRHVCAVKALSERRMAVKIIGSAVRNTLQRWKQQRQRREEEVRLAHDRLRRQGESVIAIQHIWRRVCAVKALLERRTAVKTISSAVRNTLQRWKQQRQQRDEEKLARDRRQEESVLAIQHIWRRVCAMKELSERRTAVKIIGSAVRNTLQRWKRQRQQKIAEECANVAALKIQVLTRQRQFRREVTVTETADTAAEDRTENTESFVQTAAAAEVIKIPREVGERGEKRCRLARKELGKNEDDDDVRQAMMLQLEAQDKEERERRAAKLGAEISFKSKPSASAGIATVTATAAAAAAAARLKLAAAKGARGGEEEEKGQRRTGPEARRSSFQLSQEEAAQVLAAAVKARAALDASNAQRARSASARAGEEEAARLRAESGKPPLVRGRGRKNGQATPKPRQTKVVNGVEYERVGGGWAPLNHTSSLWQPRDAIRMQRKLSLGLNGDCDGGGGGGGYGSGEGLESGAQRWRSAAAPDESVSLPRLASVAVPSEKGGGTRVVAIAAAAPKQQPVFPPLDPTANFHQQHQQQLQRTKKALSASSGERAARRRGSA